MPRPRSLPERTRDDQPFPLRHAREISNRGVFGRSAVCPALSIAQVSRLAHSGQLREGGRGLRIARDSPTHSTPTARLLRARWIWSPEARAHVRARPPAPIRPVCVCVSPLSLCVFSALSFRARALSREELAPRVSARARSQMLTVTERPRLPGPTPRVKPFGPSIAAESSGTHVSCRLVLPAREGEAPRGGERESAGRGRGNGARRSESGAREDMYPESVPGRAGGGGAGGARVSLALARARAHRSGTGPRG